MAERPEPVETDGDPRDDEAGETEAVETEAVETEAVETEAVETEAVETEAEESVAEAAEAPEGVEASEPESPPAPEPARGKQPRKAEFVQTVGRRKEAVARVLLRRGQGEIRVNGRRFEEYFPVLRHRTAVEKPLKVAEAEGLFDVRIRTRGGGLTGQAEAAQLGVARALVEFDEDRRAALRAHGMLTRDPRAVERKKPGRPKARKKFQFSKR